jgi:hypothetical protein
MPKLPNIAEIDGSPVVFNLDSLAISALLAISISSPREFSHRFRFGKRMFDLIQSKTLPSRLHQEQSNL